MHTAFTDYHCGDDTLEGFLAFKDSHKAKLPGIIIAHAWRGQDDFTRDKAEAFANMGYFAMAADVYGKGLRADNDERAGELMAPLFTNRKLLRERITAAYAAIQRHPKCDTDRIAAVGFCFGGLTVIELMRSGAQLRGIVSFHGVYGNQIGPMTAKTEPNARKLNGSALLMHGYEDPLLTPNDILALQKELNDAQVDWQMHEYGHTSHAFTNPMANSPEQGLLFNPSSNRRAWQSAHLFLEEIFA